MTTGLVLLLFCAALCAAAAAAAQKHTLGLTPEWDFRNEDGANARGCANLTLVLDNWKFAIMTQVRDLLLHDHSTVLPDYGRIQPLSDAMGDLYKEFNALKERLTALTAGFDRVEGFLDDEWGRMPRRPRGKARPQGPPLTGATAPGAGGRPHRRRTRVVVRRITKPAASQNWH